MAVEQFLSDGWAALQIALIVVAVATLVSSIDDAFVDLFYWLLRIDGVGRRLPRDALKAKEEGLMAVMIPAWDESEIIGRMLANSVRTIDYQNYHIFVGVYSNDSATQREVEQVAATYPHVHCVDVGHPGPTNKADCVNAIIRSVLDFETKHGLSFRAVVNQDAEDVVHPLSLTVLNWFVEKYALVQIPVFSLDRNPLAMIGCHYMDEFAEWHNKDLIVRSYLTHMTPSAGVGTAISRAGLDALLAKGDGEVFNTNSLTEDYHVAHQLKQLGHRSRFVNCRVRMPAVRKNIWGRWVASTQVQIVSTREFFPKTFRPAYRQKARWLLGIAYISWRQLGWYGGWWDRYFLWRDRKAIFTTPVTAAGYLVAIASVVYVGLETVVPALSKRPPLVDGAWVWWLIACNLVFLSQRLFHRAYFTHRTNGARYAFLSPVRALVGNVIGMASFYRAQKQWLEYVITGKRLTWEKTRHQFPHKGAPVAQSQTTDVRREEIQVARARAALYRTEWTTFDATTLPRSVRALAAPNLVRHVQAVPITLANEGEVVVALAEPLSAIARATLEKALARAGARTVQYKFAARSEIAAAINIWASDARKSDAASGQIQWPLYVLVKRRVAPKLPVIES